jgi:hypothetical protein
MELSSIFLIFLVAITLGTGLLYSVLELRPSATYAISTPDGSKSGSLSTPVSLGNTQQVYDSFFSPAAATLSLFVYVNSRIPSSDATILRIGDALTFKITPGGPGSPPETQLVINQTTGVQPIYTIKCANLPLQKWTHITIVREGRRFTVFYNGKVAADERSTRNIQSVLSQISIGSIGLPGEWALLNLTPYAFRLDDIQEEISKNSDTRGVPSITPTGGGFNLFSCPSGIFCFSANTSQQSTLSPLRRWTTSYA